MRQIWEITKDTPLEDVMSDATKRMLFGDTHYDMYGCSKPDCNEEHEGWVGDAKEES